MIRKKWKAYARNYESSDRDDFHHLCRQYRLCYISNDENDYDIERLPICGCWI